MQAFLVFFRYLPGALCIRFSIAGRRLLRNCHNVCRLIVPIHDRRPGSEAVAAGEDSLKPAVISRFRGLARLRCAIGEME